MSSMRKGLGERIESGDLTLIIFTQFWWEDVTESDTGVHTEQGVSREIFKSFFSHFDEIKFNFQEQEDVTFFTSVRLWRYDNVWVEEMDEEAQKGTRCSLKNCDKDRSSSRGSLAGSFCPIIWHYLTWPSVCKYEQLSSHNTINYNQPHSSPLQISVIVGMATEWGEESLYAGPLHWDVKDTTRPVLSPQSSVSVLAWDKMLQKAQAGASWGRVWRCGRGYLLMFSDGLRVRDINSKCVDQSLQ